MAYSQVINGVTVTSNVPFGFIPPAGSLVTMDLHFNLPVAGIEQLGYNLLTMLGQPTFQSQLLAQGYNLALGNYNVFELDGATERITFIMPAQAVGISSPYVTQAAAMLILYTVAVIIAAAIAIFIVNIGGSVAGAVASTAPYVLAAVGVVAAVGLGAFVYDFLKSPDFRREAYREVGRTGKQAVGGSIRIAGATATAAGRGALKLKASHERARAREEKLKEERRMARMELKYRKREPKERPPAGAY